MQKIYRNELGPEPIPLIVPGEAVNEEDVSLSRYCLVSVFDHGPCRCIMGNVFYTPYEYALKTHLPLRCISSKRTVGVTQRMKIEWKMDTQILRKGKLLYCSSVMILLAIVT